MGDLSALVIPAEDCDSVAVPDFECHQESDRLHRVVPSINIVSHEQVVGVGTVAAYSEQLQKILKLPVNVAADCDRAFDRLDVALLYEDFPGLVA